MSHAEERHLSKAPITEAVIDLMTRKREDFREHFAKLRAALEKSFETIEEHVADEIAGATVGGGPRGLIFRSESSDRAQALQVSENGFAFSKLRPYTSWEDVRDSAKMFWEIYRSIVPVDVVTRLGVRFINVFSIPTGRQLADYLTVKLPLPETVSPHEVTQSLSRLSVHESESGIFAHVYYVSKSIESGTTIVIDTDASMTRDFDAQDSELWQTLEQLRRTKNRIFFGSITESAAKEFDQ